MRAFNNRKKHFEDYFDSIYFRSNRLTPEEYENTCKTYDLYYGNYLPIDKNAPILDIGCGAGHFLYYLKKMGYTNFMGIDRSSDSIEYCRKNKVMTIG